MRKAHADEDKKASWSSSRRATRAEALVHSIKKSLTEYGDKLDSGEKEQDRLRHQGRRGAC